MILVIDTETQDLPDFKKRASDPSQPHVLQFAAAILHPETFAIEAEQDLLVKPDGWEISQGAFDRHGISHQYATENGFSEAAVTEVAVELIWKASLVVGHNITFDKFMMRIAARRFGFLSDAQDAAWKMIPTFCTMNATTNICQLPGGRGGAFKWPKLSEAYKSIMGREMDGAHNALSDVRATVEILRFLHKRGLVPI